MMLFRLCTFVDPLYAEIYHFQAYSLNSTRHSSKGIAAKNFNIVSIRPLSFFVPPEAEQKRIVAKVSTLLSQCDKLAAQLRARQATTESLLTALIHRILEGGIEAPG